MFYGADYISVTVASPEWCASKRASEQARSRCWLVVPPILHAPATWHFRASHHQLTHACFRTSAARVLRRQWEVLKPDIFACIMDFYNSGQPLILEGATGLSGAGALIEARSSVAPVPCNRGQCRTPSDCALFFLNLCNEYFARLFRHENHRRFSPKNV